MQIPECSLHFMVQNATSGGEPDKPAYGRRPNFDRDTVVTAAIEPFWAKGFAGTTLTDLEQATGVDRSTLYNSFDGKTGLHRSASAAYVKGANEYLFESLFQGTQGIADIECFLYRLGAELQSEAHPRGCLIINDMNTGADPAAKDTYLRSLDKGLAAALDRAIATGETDPDKAEQRRHLLLTVILGLNLANKNASHPHGTADLLDSIRAEVETWNQSQQ
jgi:AcrR family transcriptional regulator